MSSIAESSSPRSVPERGRSLGGRRSVTVVGAGFSGLAAAFYLSRAGFQVEVIEESDRAGGMISTIRTPFGFVETAANGLLNSALVEELFGLIGLEVQSTLKTARKRFIFRHRGPRRWPIGWLASLRLAGFAALYFLARPLVAPRKEESVRDWANRVMGREAAQYLVEAALQGIYAGDPNRLSARLIFSGFFSRRKLRRAPRVRGTVAPPDGMGQLIDRLQARLESFGVRFRFNQSFAELTHEPEQPLVLALPAYRAAQVLKTIDPVRAEALSKIECLPVVSATISFAAAPEAKGFGLLFPPVEGRRALGVLMNNFIFPLRTLKGFSETWIFGGARGTVAGLLEMNDETIVQMAAEERQGTLGVGGEVLGKRVARWPKGLPHYTLELERSLPELTGLRQNTVLIGNYLGQIGLAKILERAADLPGVISARGQWNDQRSGK